MTAPATRFARFVWTAVNASASDTDSIFGEREIPICLINQNLFDDNTPRCTGTYITDRIENWNGPRTEECEAGQPHYNTICKEFFGITVPCNSFFSYSTTYTYNCNLKVEDFPGCTRGSAYTDADPVYGDSMPNPSYADQRTDLDDYFSEAEVFRSVKTFFTPPPVSAGGDEEESKKAYCYYDPSIETHEKVFSTFNDEYTKTVIGDGIDTSNISDDVVFADILEDIKMQRTAELSKRLKGSSLDKIKRFSSNLLGDDGIGDIYRLLRSNIDGLRAGDLAAKSFFVGLFIAFIEDEVEQGVLEIHFLGEFQRGVSRLETNDFPPPTGIRTLAQRENYKMETRASIMTVVLDGIATLSPAVAITSMETRYMSSKSRSDEVDATKAAMAVAAAVNAAGVTAAAVFGVMPPDAAAAAISQALNAAAALALSGDSSSTELTKTSNYFVEIVRPAIYRPPIPNTTIVDISLNAGNDNSQTSSAEAIPPVTPVPSSEPKVATGVGTEVAVSIVTTFNGREEDVSKFAGVVTTGNKASSLTLLQARKITLNEPIWAEFLLENVLEMGCKSGEIGEEECVLEGKTTAMPSMSPSAVPSMPPSAMPSIPPSHVPSSAPSHVPSSDPSTSPTTASKKSGKKHG
jgi:hypothetical protein